MYAKERIDRRIQHTEKRGDFWDLVLEQSDDGNKSGKGMSPAEMLTNAAVLVLGGSETAATVLSACVYLLLTHKEAAEKVYAEIRATFADERAITLDSVSRLPYTLAVLDEAQRMFPASPQPQPRMVPTGGAEVVGKFVPEGVSRAFFHFA
jgi:cytochrome P450